MKKSLLLFLLLIAGIVHAQTNITVTGMVMDGELNEPIIGANIVQRGVSHGSITNLDGYYSISVPIDAELIYSFVGMQTQVVKVGGRSAINVTMKTDAKTLDEVIVVGYGTTRKRDLTGSIVSLKGDELISTPSSSPMAALQGKVAGMNITTSGAAGSSPSITIRGVGSMGNSNPYYIVDGMFTDNIDFVNSSDIASIEVLKDASSLAMFGVKGANGIIIITTKQGSKGKVLFNIDSYTGFQTVMKGDRVKLANGNQFTEWYNELLTNSKNDLLAANPNANVGPEFGTFSPQIKGKGTDWIDKVTRVAMITSQSISASSATDKSHSFFSLGYFNQDGVVKYDNYERYTARLSSDYAFNKWAKIGGNVALSYWSKDANSFMGYGDILTSAVRAMPTYAPLNEDGSYMMPNRMVQARINNPVALSRTGKYDNKSHGVRMMGNIFADILFCKKLTYHFGGYVDLGINSNKLYKEQFRYDANFEQPNSYLSRNTDEFRTFQQDHTLTWDDKRGDHRFKVMLGFTSNYQSSEGFNAARDSINLAGRQTNLPDEFQMLTQGKVTTATNGDNYSEESQLSYFGRVNYSYKDRYIVAATLRRDGSSKFAKDNRWGTFPSVGLGWIVSEEKFMKEWLPRIDYLKLKGSWGKLGSDRSSGRYDYYQFISPNGQIGVIGNSLITLPSITGMADSRLTWEKMEGTEIGFEGQYFGARLSSEFTFFNRVTKDFLATVPVPAAVGQGFMKTNAGSMRNRGFELSLGWNDTRGDWNYMVGANLTYTKNKVISLGDGSEKFDGPCITKVGETIASFYGYKTAGVFQSQAEVNAYVNAEGKKMQPNAKVGDLRFKDVDGNGTISEKDRTILGSYLAPVTYGIDAKVNYKGFDLGVELAGVAGNELFNSKKTPYNFNQFNFLEGWKHRWHGEGTSNTYPILSNQRPDNMLNSDFFVESGSYIRLRTLQLGYTFPKEWMQHVFINKLRVYVNAQNLVTLSSFNGWTPEVGGSPLQSGVDSGALYPIPASVTFGFNLNF
ncbi:MAG: TonB-dependent receptor [Bacteroidaceae bacterium]